MSELYFIDIETVGSLGICQIGITRWNRYSRTLKVVFNEIINPHVPPEEINIHAVKTHAISEYMWSNAETYYYHHPSIRNLLWGKTVLQWGGADIAIIKKNIESYRLNELYATTLNSWGYHFKGTSLKTAAKELRIEYNGSHDASYDSYLAALLFVWDFFGYNLKPSDFEFLNSFKSRSTTDDVRFKINNLKTNGSGDEICLTGFTTEEKMNFSELLSQKGFKIRSSVTKTLRFLITPSGSYKRSPSKEAEANRVGAKIIDLNSFLSNRSHAEAISIDSLDFENSIELNTGG